ncbi:ribokinase [Oscillospiraceae bacterium 42-9]
MGSFVKDLIVSTRKFPGQGETVLGCGFQMATGGKGANQAIQAARLGARVTMVGKVGDDDFGKDLINACLRDGIDCSRVMTDRQTPSSVGNVQLQVDENGATQNRIIVVPGANMSITLEEVAFLEREIAQYDMVLLQLEIPLEVNRRVMEYARRSGVPVMLNTAPADGASRKLISGLTYVASNESEAEALTGAPIRFQSGSVDLDSVRAAVERFLEMGVQNVLITLGGAGAAFGNRREFFLIPAVDGVVSVDPTGAGDSFIGAFSTFVSAGADHRAAVRMANYVGSLTVSVLGAQTSLPSLEQINRLIQERGETELLFLPEKLTRCG